jgi:hypothetical protein
MRFYWKAARVALSAVVLAWAGIAQSHVVYDLGFDPPGFFGSGHIQIDQSCLSENGGPFSSNSEDCPIDLLDVQVHDSAGGNWSLTSAFNIATAFDVVNNNLFDFDSIVLNLTFEGFDNTDRPTGVSSLECNGQLQFFREDRVVTFSTCYVDDNGHYVIPEPASGALILAGMGAAWLARRRRRVE